MFPEFRDLISRLKNENPRFMSLFDKHNKLDHESDGVYVRYTLSATNRE